MSPNPTRKVTTDQVAQVSLYSYSSKEGGKQKTCHYEVDCNEMRDPFGNGSLKQKWGDDPSVIEWIKADKRIPAIVDAIILMARSHMTFGGDLWLSVGFHDLRGWQISPAVVEIVAAALLERTPYTVSVDHLEIL